MVKQLPDRPFLPKAGKNPELSVLVSRLTDFLGQVITRSNGLLPKDGTERATAPLPLAVYTVTTLPSASVYTNCLIVVSNGTGNKRLALSDGTNWRFPDGNVVS